MPRLMTCPRGHHWQAETEKADAAADCPICTEFALGKALSQADADGPTLVATPAPRGSVPAYAPTIPGYEIQGVLGTGGMGVVYKAYQTSLKRTVALKMLLNEASKTDILNRFRAEAEAVAQLQHPNIVQIYDIGDHQGRPFFAMEYVDGTSLGRALAQGLFPFRESAQIIATLAEAILCAHERGIIHRDLKPANILLARGGAVSGVKNPSDPSLQTTHTVPLTTHQAKITDFGLAKRLNADGPTVTGEILGTPNYMPPEQAKGDLAAIGPASDIYGLGAILYEMLTGKPPFEGQSATMTLWLVVNEDPVPPSRLRPHLPPDLETICLTCLNKDPRGRYTSARKLAEDLQMYLAGASIQARPATRGQRVRRWLRAHPATALFVGIGGLALIGVLVGLWLQSALAVGALAIVSLCVGAWWYSARLERALAEVRQQNVFSQRSVERMHLLLETVHRLLAAPKLDQRLRILGEASARLVNAERATIFLIDQTRQELWSKLATGEESTVIRIPLDSGIAGSVAKTGKIVNLADPYNDPRFNSDVDRRTGFTTRNLLTVPMTDAAGRRLGVFQVLNKRGGCFGPEDVEILSNLARSAALMVGDD
jgi:eukaryotic-like serine/threonine-protein kinase